MNTRRDHAAQTPQCTACGEPEPLYTKQEAAELLRVPVSWLEKKAAAGLIPATYVGRYLRFTAGDIREIQQTGARRPITDQQPDRRPPAKVERGRTGPRRRLRIA